MALLIALKVRTLSYRFTQKAFIHPKSDVLTLRAKCIYIKTIFVHFYYWFYSFPSIFELHYWIFSIWMLAPLPRSKSECPGWCTPGDRVCLIMSSSGRPPSGSTDRIQKLRKEYYQARREGFTLYEDDEGRARLDYDFHWVSPCMPDSNHWIHLYWDHCEQNTAKNVLSISTYI